MATTDAKMIKVKQKTKNEKAKILWDLLDDIDTATDRFHPVNGEKSMQGWYEYVQRKIKLRYSVLHSDGYYLYDEKD